MEQQESKPYVLLVEDTVYIAQAYKDGLEHAGYEVAHAKNGVEALEKMRERKPGLVMLDLVMPEKNGFEVLKEMRKDDTLKDIKVCVFSNLGQDKDVAEATRLGADDFLIKSDRSMREVVEKVSSFFPEMPGSSE